MRRRSRFVLGLLLPLATAAWLDAKRDRVQEANRLVETGRAEEAIPRYGEALIDEPDSALLNYNMGNAHYAAGKFTDALASWSRARPDERDPQRLARIAFNSGNAHFRLAEAKEKEKPKEALQEFVQALASYRRAIGADAGDVDSKVNYEISLRRIEALQRRIEEEERNRPTPSPTPEPSPDSEEPPPAESPTPDPDAPPSDEGGGPPPPTEPRSEERPTPPPGNNESPSEDSPDESPEDSPEEPGEESPPPPEDGSGPGEESPPEEPAEPEPPSGEGEPESDVVDPPSEEEQARREAAAILDAARNEEVSPQEFLRRRQPARIGEPRQDW